MIRIVWVLRRDSLERAGALDLLGDSVTPGAYSRVDLIISIILSAPPIGFESTPSKTIIGRLMSLGCSNINANNLSSSSESFGIPSFLNEGLAQEKYSDTRLSPIIPLSSSSEKPSTKKSRALRTISCDWSQTLTLVQVLQRP